MTVVMAVNVTAGAPVIRAAPARMTARDINLEVIGVVRGYRVNAAAWHGTKLVHALFYGAGTAHPNQ